MSVANLKKKKKFEWYTTEETADDSMCDLHRSLFLHEKDLI